MNKKIFFLFILTALAIRSNAQSNGWTIETSPASVTLRAVSYSNADIWVAVGDGGTIIRSLNGGITWVNIPSPVADNLFGVCMHGTLGIAVGAGGRVLRSTDAGQTWVQEPRPTTRDLYSVSISDQMAVITGREGFIFVSYDNGMSWATHTAGTASFLFGVSVNGTSAVGVGGQGAVVMSVNGGSGWGLTVIGSQTTFFYGTSFVNSTTGWLVGSTVSPGNVIARSNNGGFSWIAEAAPTTEQLFAVSFTTVDSGTAVGGSGAIIHTVNGGASWESQASPTTQILHGVSFANSGIGIAVGDLGTILRTGGGITGISASNNEPGEFRLSQNYPNPFNPSTKIDYRIAKSSMVKLVIYDMLGSEVKDLVNQTQAPGNYSVEFDASNLSSGTYFYKLETGEFTDTKKMAVVK